MNDLVVKSVDVLGGLVTAVKDDENTIWVGINYFCQGLDMNKKQRDYQVEKIKADKTLKKGSRKFPAGIFDASHEMYALRLDFIPMWLSKITITDKMEQDHPDLAEKLLNYQLKAKDILAAAFLPKQSGTPADLRQQIQTIAKGTDELYQRVDAVDGKVDEVRAEIESLRDELPLFPSEADKIKDTVNKRVVFLLGGKESNAYKDDGLRRKVFINCYQNLKGNFEVGKYTEIKRKYRHEAQKIAEKYEPPFFLAEQIENANAQQRLDV